jgi:hypothetical protein
MLLMGSKRMTLRHTAALAGFALIGAILIYALMPRYYLIVAFPEKPIVQLGPFATQAGCERARQLIPGIVAGGEPLNQNGIDKLTAFLGCVSSR